MYTCEQCGATSRGVSLTATLTTYLDYHCPYCGSLEGNMHGIGCRYSGEHVNNPAAELPPGLLEYADVRVLLARLESKRDTLWRAYQTINKLDAEGDRLREAMRALVEDNERLRVVERAARVYFREFDHLVGDEDYPERRDLREALDALGHDPSSSMDVLRAQGIATGGTPRPKREAEDDADGEDYTNRDFDHEAAIDSDFYD